MRGMIRQRDAGPEAQGGFPHTRGDGPAEMARLKAEQSIFPLSIRKPALPAHGH